MKENIERTASKNWYFPLLFYNFRTKHHKKISADTFAGNVKNKLPNFQRKTKNLTAAETSPGFLFKQQVFV